MSSSVARSKTIKSQTLMRHAVKKPTDAKPQIEHRSTPVGVTPVNQDMNYQPKSSLFGRSDKERVDRAKQVNKSRLVSKFSDFNFGGSKKSADQPVTATVATTPMPVVKAPAEPAAPTPVVPRTAGQQKSDQLVKRGMQNATSHTQPMARKPKLRARAARRLGTSTKVVSVGAAAFAVLLLGSFFAYQNVPNFAMRVAAARSGVHASMPGYQPAGFAVKGPVHYNNGEVIVSYNANADTNRKYTITQKNSDWSSDALLSNYVAVGNKMYQTYQDQGRTIYIYNGTNATWVNQGVWYNIAGNANLNGEQLVHIATSM